MARTDDEARYDYFERKLNRTRSSIHFHPSNKTRTALGALEQGAVITLSVARGREEGVLGGLAPNVDRVGRAAWSLTIRPLHKTDAEHVRHKRVLR